MFASHRVTAAIAVAFLVASTTVCSKSASQGSAASARSSGKSKIAKNLTDLPTYPNLSSGMMMGHPPTQGGLYDAHTSDSYETVLAWYRAKLPGAIEKKSIVDGVNGQKGIELHLAKWNEQVVITSSPGSSGTAIALGQDAHH
jgi:hypothetical protein